MMRLVRGPRLLPLLFVLGTLSRSKDPVHLPCTLALAAAQRCPAACFVHSSLHLVVGAAIEILRMALQRLVVHSLQGDSALHRHQSGICYDLQEECFLDSCQCVCRKPAPTT